MSSITAVKSEQPSLMSIVSNHAEPQPAAAPAPDQLVATTPNPAAPAQPANAAAAAAPAAVPAAPKPQHPIVAAPIPAAGHLNSPQADVDSVAMKAIKQQFLQNFEYVELERYIDADMSGNSKKPVQHDHIRFRMCGEDRKAMNDPERLMFLSRQIDRGTFLLRKMGMNIDEVHVDQAGGALVYNAEFERLPEGKTQSAALKEVVDQLQQECKEARKTRKAAIAGPGV